jgi:hypothetical protein
LQADADAKAERERRALQAKADTVKTPEKKAMYQQQAEAVIPPTVTVQARTADISTQRRWKVKAFDPAAFTQAAAVDGNVRGYIDYGDKFLHGLERAKANNKGLEIPGVKFDQVTV